MRKYRIVEEIKNSNSVVYKVEEKEFSFPWQSVRSLNRLFLTLEQKTNNLVGFKEQRDAEELKQFLESLEVSREKNKVKSKRAIK